MALSQYRKKRHFSKTPEPAAKSAVDVGWHYVIQKHDASHLHYDFRLELDHVLKSWAIPKGPSLDPSVKRLAVQVEDHPVAYREFEGTIPQGQYGGGTVLLWDTGTWEPIGDPHDGLKSGKLKFTLHGEKLHGGWSLIRTRLQGSSSDRPQWLLIKERDDSARTSNDEDILNEQPLSVATGRDLDAIASNSENVWTSNHRSRSASAPSPKKPRAAKTSASRRRQADVEALAGAQKSAMPSTIEVQLATLTESPPDGDEWLHEIKFDGYRMICRLDSGQVQFVTRNQQDWTNKLQSLVPVIQGLAAKQAILDGEIVVLQSDGTTDFQALQNAFRDGQFQDVKYYAFDLLYLDGSSLMQAPLKDRKQALERLLARSNVGDVIRYSEHVTGSGDAFKQHACRMKLEGMISKRADQPYRPGRGYDWLKIKCLHKDEFVIGGFTEPSGSREKFGALLVGFHDDKGQLRYAGKVGTGFSQKDLEELSSQFNAIEQSKSPFSDLVSKTGDVRTAHWLKPTLVGQFSYGSRTREGRLRHASFQGLREDKSPEKVTLDQPIPVTVAEEKSNSKSTARRQGKSDTQRAKANSRERSPSRSLASNETKDSLSGVRLTHPDKILYPEAEATKQDVAQYLQDVSEWILPHLMHRPLVLVRCPDGQSGTCFYQKHPGKGVPAVLRQIPIEEKHKTENYLVVDDVSGLVALAQLSVLEIHAWGSREDNIERPDRLIFDLDPDPLVSWERVVQAARDVRDFLKELGLESFVKTTGGKGLHLVVPIERHHDWDEAKSFCKNVAECIVKASPGEYTSNPLKATRRNKIFLDYLRNGRGATAVVPYSLRAKPTATVSVPLTWNELTPQLHSDHFTIRNVGRRLAALSRDPWTGFDAVRQRLTTPIRKLESFLQVR